MGVPSPPRVPALRAAVPPRGVTNEEEVCMVDDVGRRPLDELRLSIDHLRAAAGLLVRGGWRDVSSLWRSGARVALDARRRVERLLPGFSRRRDPQLTLIDLPDSIASRLESAWRKARADMEERWGAQVMAKRLGQLWEGPMRDALGGLGRWAQLAVRPLRRQEAPATPHRAGYSAPRARRHDGAGGGRRRGRPRGHAGAVRGPRRARHLGRERGRGDGQAP